MSHHIKINVDEKITELVGRGYDRPRIMLALNLTKAQLKNRLERLKLHPKRQSRGGLFLTYLKLQGKK